jgi:nitroreductase
VKAPRNKQTEIDKSLLFDRPSAELFLRSRRSIRGFKKEPVPREKLLQLLEITRYAPSASNSQGISFKIVEDTTIVRKAVKLACEWIASIPSAITNPYYLDAYYKNEEDTILRGAPHLILSISPAGFHSGRETFFSENNDSATTPAGSFVGGRENSIFKMAYMELYAQSLGLATCWAGIMEMCISSGYSPLLELFQLSQGEKITGAVMVGYPKYGFQRLVERNPLKASFL